MERKIVISINNRDGASLWFENVYDNIYIIKSSKKYVLEYACENYDKLPDDSEDYDAIYHINNFMDGNSDIKARILSFDPSGGPYISIGSNINGYTVKRIFQEINKQGTLFELEKN